MDRKLIHICEVCGKTEILTPEEGVLADVPSIHRMAIDRQVERGKKNDID